jgi:hypothetical protein
VFPFHLLLVALLGWVEREQRTVIHFLREENRALKAQLRGRRIRLTDDQRRRLAVLGQQIGRRALGHIATLVTPDRALFTDILDFCARVLAIQIRQGRLDKDR